MDVGEDSDLSTSVDIEADDVDENDTSISDPRTCRKTSYPHVFQFYMFSSNLFSPGTFSISSSNKFYWQRITEAHNISSDLLNAEIFELNRCVLWYMLLPKLLWIIPWICLPIGVVIYAVEDGYNHPDASHHESHHELHQHLFWAYNGLFIFVGGGIGGVLLATQLWNHCWYLCLKAMAKKINTLNKNELWLNKYCCSFDIQCDIPVLAGRSYGRAYYKIVITIHHDYLLNNNNNNNNNNKRPQIISLKQPSSFDFDFDDENRDDNLTNPPTIINDPSLDLFKSLHTSIRRRHESTGLNMSLGIGQATELPRTVSVTMGQVANAPQIKMNYIRAKSLQAMQYQQQQQQYNSNIKEKEDIKEEKEELQIEKQSQSQSQTDIDNDKTEHKHKHKYKHKQKHKHKKPKIKHIEKKKKETKESSSAQITRATLKGTQSNSLFNVGGFVSKSILNDKSTRSMLMDTRNKSNKSNNNCTTLTTNDNININNNNTNKKDKSLPNSKD